MRGLEARMLEALQLPAGNCEPLRFFRYAEGESFGLHHDASSASTSFNTARRRSAAGSGTTSYSSPSTRSYYSAGAGYGGRSPPFAQQPVALEGEGWQWE